MHIHTYKTKLSIILLECLTFTMVTMLTIAIKKDQNLIDEIHENKIKNDEKTIFDTHFFS